jgi:hypothetical protein
MGRCDTVKTPRCGSRAPGVELEIRFAGLHPSNDDTVLVGSFVFPQLDEIDPNASCKVVCRHRSLGRGPRSHEGGNEARAVELVVRLHDEPVATATSESIARQFDLRADGLGVPNAE